jgi:mannose-6-phosphate isomerase-like protein (cupin superfamily)
MHRKKDETPYVTAGKGKILVENREIDVNEGDTVRVCRGKTIE